jgi:hypothetical protein
MKLKLLGQNVDNASANNIGEATLVRVHCTAAATLTLRLASGGAIVGSVYIGANETVLIEKNPTEEITCATSKSTKVAYNS